ncbi:hypothetical protein OWM54_26425 [Myxococcus sp. MISCRS1]|uniref:hypothetical protein n=1 Tax=unclassified Myxococcus TaxID=2648731 RepID=UPI001CBD1493|nr:MULTISPECIES: hypothetical protein [unclassified Myxococcus]MBZ4396258.1 hypothetical protein [Myxococcus sp. AS-1-15]MCY1000688.1 hypothetical protein [Myxococcus sp. MISCRS1]BDT37768.1 hypothetical protein MFMH1_74370 [Myxococcus sp. MH1]
MSETFEKIQSVHSLYQLVDEESEQVPLAWEIYSGAKAALATPDQLDEGEADTLTDWRGRYLNILARLLNDRSVRSICQTMRTKAGPFRKMLTVNQPSRDIDNGLGPSRQRTRMFAEWQARPFQVFIRGGLFYRRHSSGKLSLFDTSRMESHGKACFGGYVLDLEQRLYVFNHLDKEDRIAHSTFVRGAPTRSAGEIRVLNGRLQMLTNHSGHYRPDKKSLHDTLVYFQSQGVVLAGALVAFVVDPQLALVPLTPEQLPWVFLSDVGTLQVVKELVDDEVSGILDLQARERRRVALLKQRSFEQNISSRFVYKASAFVNAVAQEDALAQQALDDLFPDS